VCGAWYPYAAYKLDEDVYDRLSSVSFVFLSMHQNFSSIPRLVYVHTSTPQPPSPSTFDLSPFSAAGDLSDKYCVSRV
jgi:hypothetical protein